MHVTTVPIRDLTEADVQRWNAWAAPDGELVSPYLLHDFAAAVNEVRGDVRVAVIRETSSVIGYFAHHAPKGGAIRPVGAPMSDYQGIVAAPGVTLNPADLLSESGACALVYDNWYRPSAGLAGLFRERNGSAICDLSQGADTFFAAQRALYRDHFRKLDRRRRKAEEMFGPMRAVLGDPGGHHFHTLAAWKSAQYRATGKLDVLSVRWARQLLRNLGHREGSPFGTLTAALYFGDHLAAVETGLKAGGVYHSWFPAYDPAFAKFSPGLLLIHAIAEHATELGIARMDLGRDGGHYKKYYASYEVPLEAGRVLSPGLAALAIRGWETAEQCARVLPRPVGDLPARLRRRWAQVSAFEPEFGPRLATLARSLRAEPNAA